MTTPREFVPYAAVGIATIYAVAHPDWVGACVYGLGHAVWVLAAWLDVRGLRAENTALRTESATQRAELQKYKTRDR